MCKGEEGARQVGMDPAGHSAGPHVFLNPPIPGAVFRATAPWTTLNVETAEAVPFSVLGLPTQRSGERQGSRTSNCALRHEGQSVPSLCSYLTQKTSFFSVIQESCLDPVSSQLRQSHRDMCMYRFVYRHICTRLGPDTSPCQTRSRGA